MSSICSANSCTKPDGASTNVSSNKINKTLNNETSAGDLRNPVPDVKKDNRYWERRLRNNEAARRSREKRRMNDMDMDQRIVELAERNKQLEQELLQIHIEGGTPIKNDLSKHRVACPKKVKLTPIIPATETTKEKVQTTQLNGMVFPILTNVNPINCTTANSDYAKINELFNSLDDCKQNIQNDTKRFHTGLLTLSNIPFLSNLIVTPNFNDDIALKPTLLLPPFQMPTKSIDRMKLQDTQVSVTSIVPEAVQYNYDCQQENGNSNKKDAFVIKTEPSDILDLRMNTDCVFANEFLSNFGVNAVSNEDINDHLQSFDEPLHNSFLSGSVQTMSCNDSFPGNIPFNKTNRKYPQKTTRRQNRFNESRKVYYRQHCRPSMNQSLNLRTKLQIRKEVDRAICNENSKLHESIRCLSYEIKELKSVLMTIAATSVMATTIYPPPNIESSICHPRDSTNWS